ncbi:MAG: 50S ribosomal protein L15 [Candidatus Aenigmarchaeota archaeon]|nr:50S ribosomal protein L15 [Candidatus Aenigmarchaeota archaeon]
MVVRKEKKHRRGERSYHGSHKKWRGGGSRGGRGQAGRHKHKWSYVVKYEPDHFGKHGFKIPQNIAEDVKIINIEDLNRIMENLLQKNLAVKEGNSIKINLKKIGYDKLLGSGVLKQSLIVESKYFSKSAIKKLESAGGKAVIIG